MEASPSFTSNQSLPSDVRLVRDKNGVHARLRRRTEHLAEGLDAAVIFVRGNDETALGEVSCLLDALEACDDGGLISSIVFACIDLADGNTGLTDGVPKCLRQRLALGVEIPLGRDVVEVERIGIGLIGKSGAVADRKSCAKVF